MDASAEATVAVDLVPSANTMVIALLSAMTWFAVRTDPVAVAITPVPKAPLAVRTTATDGPTRW